jgi:hypothetical protein
MNVVLADSYWQGNSTAISLLGALAIRLSEVDQPAEA